MKRQFVQQFAVTLQYVEEFVSTARFLVCGVAAAFFSLFSEYLLNYQGCCVVSPVPILKVLANSSSLKII